MSHIAENQRKLGARISRIRGQIDALEKALHEGVACANFLHQVASMRGAIDGLMSEALEGHIREHLGHAHSGEHAAHFQDDLEEIIYVLKTYLK
ncbi:MAG TPA: metal/formaldehyde-sensitive transcriptional repressor [Methylophilus sp.]